MIGSILTIAEWQSDVTMGKARIVWANIMAGGL